MKVEQTIMGMLSDGPDKGPYFNHICNDTCKVVGLGHTECVDL